MIKKSPTVNLFTGRNKSFFDRFIKWALTVGRLLIILTEVIALSAFLYRFSLDRQLIDLHDKIKIEQNILNLLQTSEKKYRNLQERILLSGQLGNSSQRTVDIFKKTLALAPLDMSVNSLSLEKQNITLNANIQSISSLTSFIKKIRGIPEVKSTILDRIENRISNSTITFSLSIVLKD